MGRDRGQLPHADPNGRLLNVSDGLIGQGLNVLFCITTNETLGRLSRAVVRTGRCLANIAVTRFGRDEANAWLDGRHTVGPDGATLAELFALVGDQSPVEVPAAPAAASGLYL